MDTMAEAYNPPEATDADMNFDIAGYSPPPATDADMDFALAVYYVLAGFSNIFTGIWADPNASRTNGKMYALSWGPGTALNILNLDEKRLHDHYTQTYGGRAQETLTDRDGVDLNVDTP